jgi:ATP-dependent Clp protease ATP-binding subunit ClpB
VIAQLASRGIALELSDDALALLGNLGYDPVYGARPLKRVIQKQLVDRLAVGLLDGTYREGQTVRAENVGGELVLSTVTSPAPSAV